MTAFRDSTFLPARQVPALSGFQPAGFGLLFPEARDGESLDSHWRAWIDSGLRMRRCPLLFNRFESGDSRQQEPSARSVQSLDDDSINRGIEVFRAARRLWRREHVDAVAQFG